MKTSTPNIEISILAALLEKHDEFVSGEHLAETLGITRVAIWQHLQKLRAWGFEFEAVRNVGYRITKLPDVPNAELLRLLVGARDGRPPEIVVLDTIDSTNDEATRRLAANSATPLVVIACEQTKGRGRFGRVWHSESNGNLYMSFAFHPHTPPARMQTFTLWMGLNICDFLATRVTSKPWVKWPNDILFGNRKVAGMLTEARLDSDQIRDLVFGIGINLNSNPAHWPAELADRATSLAVQNDGVSLDANTFTAALVTCALDAYDRLIANPDAVALELAELWKKYDSLYGKHITLASGNEHISGIAEGIDIEGSLLIRTAPDVPLQKVRAGEVTTQRNAEVGMRSAE